MNKRRRVSTCRRPSPRRGLSGTLFRALLKIFPAEFRVAHEKSMEQVFDDQRREVEHEAGKAGLLKLWVSTLWGTLRTAPGEHLRIFVQDAGYALRRFTRQPSMTVIAVLTIALGIGATTAVFSLVHQVLLRPLPYPEPESLVHLRPLLEGEESVSGPIYLDLLHETRSFESLLTMGFFGSSTISGPQGAERVKRMIVSPSYFDVLGVRPLLGRGFRPEDQLFLSAEELQRGQPEELPVGPVVISHDLWQRRFGGDRGVLGSLLEIAGRPYEIIGVLADDFRALAPRSMDLDAKRDLWFLSNWDPGQFPRDVHYLEVLGRLAPGVTLDQARAEVAAFAERQRERHEESRQINYRMTVEPLHAQVIAGISQPLWLLFGAVTLVLLIACSNVASLMLAGGATRRGELGMRVALGASRERLVRLLLTESSLIATLGAFLGLAIAYLGLDLVQTLRPDALQRFEQVRVDRPMLLFTLAATALSALLFGLVPSLRYSQPNLEGALKAGRRSVGGLLRNRRRGLLVVGEIALSFVLIAGTGLLLRTFAAQQRVDLGFSPDRVTAVDLDFPYRSYPEPEDRVRLYRLLTETVAAIPGVESVGLTNSVPLDGDGGHGPIASDRAGAEEEQVWETRVAPGYFRTLGFKLLAGRWPEWRDFTDPDRQFALVDEDLAERYWPGQQAVGRQVRLSRLVFGGDDGVPNELVWAEVLGVVGSIHDVSLIDRGPETVYVGLHFKISTKPTLTFTSHGDHLAVAAAVREAISSLDNEIATSPARPMDDLVAEMTASLRFTLVLLGIFGAVGVLLAAVGLYGLLSYSVRQGTDEIGLRLALGATPTGVLKIVLAQGLKLTVLGLAVGTAASLALGPLFAHLLFGVEAHDPATLMAVAGLLGVIALVACCVPAVRALRIDPLSALRAE